MHKLTYRRLISPLVAGLLTLAGGGCASKPEADGANPPGAVEYAAEGVVDNGTAAAEAIDYPHRLLVGNREAIVHPPQIRSWERFEVIQGIAVVELVPVAEEAPRFGVVEFAADAVPDLAARTVALSNIQVTSLTEGESALSEENRQLFEDALPKARTLPLDLILSYLAEDVIPANTPGIRAQPPKIFYAQRSAILVLLHGDPIWVPLPDSELAFAANTNWPLFRAGNGTLFLNNNDTWLSADTVRGPWRWSDALPDDLKNLPDDGNWTSSREAAVTWRPQPSFPAPRVLTSTLPAELLLVIGEPEIVPIGDSGLTYVANTESELFRYDGTWFYLVSGRWFSTSDLSADAWQSVDDLPAVFADIPAEHPKSDVLAMIPGTPEASMAALDALVPTKTQVPVGTALPITVSYAGDPEFVAVDNSAVSYARNTPYDVLAYQGSYYLCYSGVWYRADDPEGPWTLATSIPDAIYAITPEFPAYHVTYVRVYDQSPTHVTYGYSGGYYHTYLYNGVPVYGSGWYYPPYYDYYGGYPVYFGYPYTYGSGSYYNPRTGTYGSVSRAYGPYGGWGYASVYNPGTKTYGRAEVRFDYNDWFLHGEAYNPVTGRYADVHRHYDADDGEWKTQASIDTRRGGVEIERAWDSDSGRLDLSSERGGAGTFARRAGDGGWDTQGSYTTADGRTIQSSGRYVDGEGSSTLSGSAGGQGRIERSLGPDGVTRTGSFSRDGRSLETRTTRSGRDVTRTIEGSEGGRAALTGRGAERTLIGQSPSGDIYGSRNGSVYKRADDGWYRRNGNEWSRFDPGRSGSVSSIANRPYRSSPTTSGYSSVYQNRRPGLDMDYRARQRGQLRSRSYTGARAGTYGAGVRAGRLGGRGRLRR